MEVRLATKNDKSQILKLFDEFNRLIKPGSQLPLKESSSIFDEIIERDDTNIFIVIEDQEILGFATFYLLPNIRHGWKRGHIEDFFVTHAKHRRGVGTFLLSSIKEYCRKNNIRVIKLDSGNELTKAHSFYEKNGGRTTERFFRFDID